MLRGFGKREFDGPGCGLECPDFIRSDGLPGNAYFVIKDRRGRVDRFSLGDMNIQKEIPTFFGKHTLVTLSGDTDEHAGPGSLSYRVS